jgi:DNA anti-recombination protein RmuC
METLMFAFGVLTMVLVAIAAIAVYSTVKVLKLKRSLEFQDRNANESIANLYRSNTRLEEQLCKMIDESDRNTQDQHNQIYREISHCAESTDRRIDELNSYVDRRFDKLVATYFTMKETEEQTKKLIKG